MKGIAVRAAFLVAAFLAAPAALAQDGPAPITAEYYYPIKWGSFDEFKARLYPDKAKLDAEEQRRFSLLEDHWNGIVVAE